MLLVGREPDPPYNRPDCSKGYLRGEESREDPLFRPETWWSEQNIELLTRTSVTGLDLGARAANSRRNTRRQKNWRITSLPKSACHSAGTGCPALLAFLGKGVKGDSGLVTGDR